MALRRTTPRVKKAVSWKKDGLCRNKQISRAVKDAWLWDAHWGTGSEFSLRKEWLRCWWTVDLYGEAHSERNLLGATSILPRWNAIRLDPAPSHTHRDLFLPHPQTSITLTTKRRLVGYLCTFKTMFVSLRRQIKSNLVTRLISVFVFVRDN